MLFASVLSSILFIGGTIAYWYASKDFHDPGLDDEDRDS